jgi:hypothetical protein
VTIRRTIEISASSAPWATSIGVAVFERAHRKREVRPELHQRFNDLSDLVSDVVGFLATIRGEDLDRQRGRAKLTAGAGR